MQLLWNHLAHFIHSIFNKVSSNLSSHLQHVSSIYYLILWQRTLHRSISTTLSYIHLQTLLFHPLFGLLLFLLLVSLLLFFNPFKFLSQLRSLQPSHLSLSFYDPTLPIRVFLSVFSRIAFLKPGSVRAFDIGALMARLSPIGAVRRGIFLNESTGWDWDVVMGVVEGSGWGKVWISWDVGLGVREGPGWGTRDVGLGTAKVSSGLGLREATGWDKGWGTGGVGLGMREGPDSGKGWVAIIDSGWALGLDVTEDLGWMPQCHTRLLKSRFNTDSKADFWMLTARRKLTDPCEMVLNRYSAHMTLKFLVLGCLQVSRGSMGKNSSVSKCWDSKLWSC